jgi:hypothetical protein
VAHKKPHVVRWIFRSHVSQPQSIEQKRRCDRAITTNEKGAPPVKAELRQHRSRARKRNEAHGRALPREGHSSLHSMLKTSAFVQCPAARSSDGEMSTPAGKVKGRCAPPMVFHWPAREPRSFDLSSGWQPRRTARWRTWEVYNDSGLRLHVERR